MDQQNNQAPVPDALKQKQPRIKRFSALLTAVLAAALTASLLPGCASAAPKASEAFTPVRAVHAVDYSEETDSFRILLNGEPIGDPIPGKPGCLGDSFIRKYPYYGFDWSADGTAGFVSDDRGTLYAVKDSSVTFLASDASSNAEVSIEGTHIAYYDRNQISLYDFSSGETIQVYSGESQLTSFAMSPNGQYLAYSIEGTLYLYHGETSKALAQDLVALYVSNSGREIYCRDTDGKAIVVTGDGQAKEIGSGIAGCILNRDHSQVIFADNGALFFRAEGGEPVPLDISCAGPCFLAFVYPHNCRRPYLMSGDATIAADTLTDHFYIFDGNAYYLREDASLVRIPGISGCRSSEVTQDGKTLYCVDGDGALFRVSADSLEPQVFVRQVADIVGVASDETVFYWDSAMTLQARKGDAEPTTISENVFEAVLSNDGYVFYLATDGMVYASDGIHPSELVLEELHHLRYYYTTIVARGPMRDGSDSDSVEVDFRLCSGGTGFDRVISVNTDSSDLFFVTDLLYRVMLENYLW